MLLVMIYLAFISLGLPDSLLGSAWPVMYGSLGVPVFAAGMITMVISSGTICSSLLSDRLTRRFGVGKVTTCSVAITAVALFGFSRSDSFLLLFLWAIPYGLGAGAVDAALNNYVALHYASRHMNWLHCFWGVGAATGPYLMGLCLANDMGWTWGYGLVAYIQILLSLALFCCLPLWRKQPGKVEGETEHPPLGFLGVLKIKGVLPVLVTFFAYCGLESTVGLWASSYLVSVVGLGPEKAAAYAALFYLGITLGRFFSGLIADYLGDKGMIRLGIGILIGGILLLVLPLPSAGAGALFVLGVGCAPIYPSIIHATPSHFGAEHSQAIVGIQMASAYTGSTLVPPVFGFFAAQMGMGVYPLYLVLFAFVMLVMSERGNRLVSVRR